ncbi:MAG: hypothetical protein GY711_11765 [bacterium]|nr:hypothetical protein [bacterium]
MNPTPQQSHLTSDVPLAAQLVERFADFVKSFAIYPENNGRVQANLAALLEKLQAGFGDEDCAPKGTINISLHPGNIRVGRVGVELRSGTNLDWLRSRLVRSLLSGLKIDSGVNAQSVVEFTRQLLEQYTRDQLDQEFEQLWQEAFEGIELLHRLFDGMFTLDELDDNGSGDGREGDGGSLSLDLESRARLVEELCEREGIRSRLDHLGALAEQAGQTAQIGDRHGIDIIGRIARLLPVEVMNDPAAIMKIIMAALDQVTETLEESEEGPEPIADSDLSKLLFAARHHLFGREGVAACAAAEKLRESAERSKPGLRPGHARDAEIVDDIDLFRADISKLPPLDDHEFERDLVLTTEQVGVLMHFLVNWESKRSRTLYGRLVELLQEPGQREIELIGTYLARPVEDDSEEAWNDWRHRHGRTSQFLAANDLAWMVREAGALDPEDVVERFPEDFTLFLHTLRAGDAQDGRTLGEICQRVGVAALDEACPLLADRDSLMLHGLPQRILSWPLQETLPIARTFLTKGGPEARPPVVAYLRSLGLDLPEACLLRVFRDPMEISEKYLVGFMQILLTGQWRKLSEMHPSPPTPLSRHISREIVRYARDNEGDPAAVGRVAYAIKFLSRFRTEDSTTLLRELAGNRFTQFLSRVPASIRDAAREVLKVY